MSLFKREDQPRERSAQDRERARLEREARRAEREGRPLPSGFGESLDLEPPPPPGEPVSFEEEPPAFEEPPAHEEPVSFEEAPPVYDESQPYEEPPAVDEPPQPVEEPAPLAEEPAPAAEEQLPVEEPPSFEWPSVESPAAEELPVPDQPPVPEEPAAPEQAPAADEPVPAAEEPPAPEQPAEPAPTGFLEQPTQAFDPFADDSPAPVPRPAGIDAPTQGFEALPPVEPDATTSADQPTQAYEALDPEHAVPPPPPRAERPETPPPPTAPTRPARPRFEDDDERPVPLRRVSGQPRTLPPMPPGPGERGRRGRGAAGGAGGGAVSSGGGRGGRGDDPTGGSGRSGRRLAALLVLVVLCAIGAWLLVSLFQPFNGGGGDPVTVKVPQNSTATDIAGLLEEEGVVSSAFFFKVRARLDGSNLRAGTYRLNEGMPYGEALERLSAGPPPPKTISVTVPEGRARREIAPVVEDAGISGSYLKASEEQEGFRPRKYGARNPPSLEGFLFPATYELRPTAGAEELVAKQVEAFEENFSEVDMARARRRNLTPYDVVIIASMVEREAQIAKERPLIAAVIHNRLRTGMPLGIDATIRYAVRNWTSPLKQSELEVDSPYNTRTRTGLPPGPIGNPGLDSMKAAANPAKSDFLFYVVKPGTCGEHNFSATDAEFQRDVEAYNEAREQAGGNSPTTC